MSSQNILITGASSGIGYDTAKILARSGHNVMAVSRNMLALQNLQSKFKNILIYYLDLSNLESINKAVDAIYDKFDSLDILINNAGYLQNIPFEQASEAEIRQTFEVNFFGAAKLLTKLIPLLKKSILSHVVNISSMGGVQGSVKFSGLSYYSASKAAISTLNECLAAEYADTNIRFNILALGAVQTPMLTKAFPNYQAPLKSEQMAEYIANFALTAHKIANGKVFPLALSNP